MEQKPLFIYFRHTPKRINFIVSYDISPSGQPKTLILRDDVNCQFVNHVLNCIKIVIKNRGGFHPRNRPDFSEIIKYLVEEKVTEQRDYVAGQLNPAMIDLMSHHKFEKVLHFPSDGNMGERIMFVPTKHQQ